MLPEILLIISFLFVVGGCFFAYGPFVSMIAAGAHLGLIALTMAFTR